MLNLTFNLFTLVVVLFLLVFIWLVLPESAKLKIQSMLFSLWARVCKEWHMLSERNKLVRQKHEETK